MGPTVFVNTQSITVEHLAHPHAALHFSSASRHSSYSKQTLLRESYWTQGHIFPYLDFLSANELKHFGINVSFIWGGNQNTASHH